MLNALMPGVARPGVESLRIAPDTLASLELG